MQTLKTKRMSQESQPTEEADVLTSIKMMSVGFDMIGQDETDKLSADARMHVTRSQSLHGDASPEVLHPAVKMPHHSSLAYRRPQQLLYDKDSNSLVLSAANRFAKVK